MLTGGSAGGLSTFLHADRAAAAIKAKSPGIKQIKAAPVVGYVHKDPSLCVDSVSNSLLFTLK